MGTQDTVSDFPIEIPNYRVLELLGYGGMATVYLAEQLRPKRKVVIKLVSPDSIHNPDPELRGKVIERLHREGDIAAHFQHPNLVTVYECGVVDGHYYIAMEYLSGGDLRQKMADGLSVDETLEICRQVADGLSEMHGKGLLHRDLKPDNVLFRASGQPVLADFGIAQSADEVSTLTSLGVISGTPQYMSPERFRNQAIDGRSDLYALGIMFYQLLTGELPYTGSDPMAIGMAHVSSPIPHLPGDLYQYQYVLNRLLAKDPGQRFQTAAELAAALDGREAAETGQVAPIPTGQLTPTSALEALPGAGPGPAQRAAKPARRPGLIMATALAVALLLGGGLWGVYRVSGPALNSPPSSAADIAADSMAVLPFVDDGLASTDAFLNEGLADELRGQLGRSGLRMAARSSSVLASQQDLDALSIAARLRVANVLEGSMRSENGTLRIYVELIEGATGLARWSRTFESPPDELLQVQQAIAREVVGLVLPESDVQLAEPATLDVDANELMLLARHYELQVRDRQFVDEDTMAEAVRLYRLATETDPESALAHSRLAGALLWLQDADAAEAPIFKALSLNPNLSEVRNTLGLYYWRRGQPEALKEFARAVELDPNNADALNHYAHALWLTHPGPTGIQYVSLLFRRALELDTLSLSRHAALGEFLGSEGRLEETRQVIRGVQELFSSAESYRLLGTLSELIGEYDRAIAWTLRARDLEPDEPDHVTKLAFLYALIGDAETARQLQPDPSLGLLYLMRRYDELVDAAEFRMIDEPGDVDARFLLAFAYNTSDQFEAAIRVLSGTGLPDSVIENTTRSVLETEAYFTLANALAGTEVPEAMALAKTLAQSSVYSGDWHGEIGWTSVYMGCLRALLEPGEDGLALLLRVRESARLLRHEAAIRDSWCFRRYAQNEDYRALLALLEERQATMRERLPATLTEFGVALDQSPRQ